MISLFDTRGVRNILCLGAHPDDIELGAGGAMLRLIEEDPDRRIRWVVFSGAGTERETEARAAAAALTSGAAECRVDVHGFRDAFMPAEGRAIKEAFEGLASEFSPDLIFTHYGEDRHQDHRLISELTWNTWRDHQILEYEILKWDGDLGQPSFYIPLSAAICEQKAEVLYETYRTQRQRPWFDRETFRSLMRVRGVECHARYAEAFHVRKMRMGVME